MNAILGPIALVMLVCLSEVAQADITVYMEAWDFLPQVEITKGRNESCEGNATVFGPQSMPKNFRQTFGGTGTNGDDICWRRTADPLNPNSGWTIWTRCSSDGDCEIR